LVVGWPYFIDVLTYHTDAVSSVSFSPDGTTLASGSRDDTVELWDVMRKAYIWDGTKLWDVIPL
jgi:WD40 repeat protein